MRSIGAALLLALAAPAQAAPRCAEDGEGGACVWGRVEGYDGAALQVRGLTLHLAGIQVPSRRDLCQNRASREMFDCSRPARKRLGEMVAKGVTCDLLDVSGDHLVARCKGAADGADLAAALVAAGTARAVKDGPYEPDQAAALAARKGLWAPDMVIPKEWEAIRRKAD